MKEAAAVAPAAAEDAAENAAKKAADKKAEKRSACPVPVNRRRGGRIIGEPHHPGSADSGATVSVASVVAGFKIPVLTLAEEIDDALNGCGGGVAQAGGSAIAAIVAGIVVEVMLRVQRAVQ